jgi:hypothetical protein
MELVAREARSGARERLDETVEFEGGDPVVVVTVAWRDAKGNPFVIGSAIPADHNHELLADSLRQSAEEAAPEEADDAE